MTESIEAQETAIKLIIAETWDLIDDASQGVVDNIGEIAVRIGALSMWLEITAKCAGTGYEIAIIDQLSGQIDSLDNAFSNI